MSPYKNGKVSVHVAARFDRFSFYSRYFVELWHV